jgi:hypothetical protein
VLHNGLDSVHQDGAPVFAIKEEQTPTTHHADDY